MQAFCCVHTAVENLEYKQNKNSYNLLIAYGKADLQLATFAYIKSNHHNNSFLHERTDTQRGSVQFGKRQIYCRPRKAGLIDYSEREVDKILSIFSEPLSLGF